MQCNLNLIKDILSVNIYISYSNSIVHANKYMHSNETNVNTIFIIGIK